VTEQGPRLRVEARKIAFAALLSCVLLACGSRWQPLRSDDGGFEVRVPGQAVKTSHRSETPLGSIDLTTFTVKLDDGRTAYMVAYNDYPPAMIKGADRDTILDRAVGGALGGKSHLVSKEPISLQRFPGRQVRATVRDGLQYKSRFYLVRDRLYQVSVVSAIANSSENDHQRFFDSFRLLLE
jgi:hypothetical protein